MDYWDIDFAPPKTHVDLYRLIKPFHKEIGLERCNLKSVEKYLGIVRADQIDGGKSVQLYEEYLTSRNVATREIILLHNFEDVLNLPKIFNILLYIEKNKIKRPDMLSEKQRAFILSLLKKNKLEFNFKADTISKNGASKLIDTLLKGNINSDELNNLEASFKN